MGLHRLPEGQEQLGVPAKLVVAKPIQVNACARRGGRANGSGAENRYWLRLGCSLWPAHTFLPRFLHSGSGDFCTSTPPPANSAGRLLVFDSRFAARRVLRSGRDAAPILRAAVRKGHLTSLLFRHTASAFGNTRTAIPQHFELCDPAKGGESGRGLL